MAETNLIVRSPYALTEILKTTVVGDAEVIHVNLEGATPVAAEWTGRVGIPVLIGPTDPVSDLPVFVDYDHHQNHEGEAYQWYYYNAALNGTVNLRLVVPAYSKAIRAPHLRIEYLADTTSNLYFFESPTVNAAGTVSTTTRSRNRSSINVPGLAIYTGATYTADGTELYRGITVATAKASLGADTAQTEWILKPSTEYMIRAVTTAATIVMIRLHWYEDLGV